MPGAGLVQQAFKAALLGGASDLDNVVDLALEAKNYNSRFNAMLPRENLSNAALIAGVGVATAAAVAGAYYLISRRLANVDDEREGFIDSVNAHVVTFLVLDSKDKRRNTVKYVAAVIAEIERNPILNKFSRLLTKTVEKKGEKGKQYNAFSIASLPFGVHFDQPREDGDNVDEAVQAINFFLGGEFVELLTIVSKEINHDFIDTTKLFLNAENHIQDLNATRLIAILLANIAINLVQGINPNNSLPLTTDELRKLCEEFRSILLTLKLGINHEVEHIKKDLVAAKKLDLFIERLEERVNVLQTAYTDKLRNDLNLDDVINGGYAVIQNITRPIRRLLYSDKLENISMFFSRLIDLNIEIKKNPNLIKRLVKKLNMPKNFDFAAMNLNKEPATVIDFMAIYASNYRSVRVAALKRFRHEDDRDLVETLEYIDDKYLKHIENITRSYGYFGKRNSPINTARDYLILFIALMLESYNVTLLDKKEGYLSSNEQALSFFNNFLENKEYYGLKYLWEHDASTHLRKYVTAEIRLVIAIRHFSLATTLSEINSGYLKFTDFQGFIKGKLENLKSTLEQFIIAKESLIEVASQNTSSKQISTRLILSEINHNVPDKFTNLADLCTNFKEDLDRAMLQISGPKFKDRLKYKEDELIAKMKLYDPSLENEQLYLSLENLAKLPESKFLENSHPPISNDNDDRLSVSSTGSNSASANFKLKLLNAIVISSGIALIIGLVFLVLMTYGVSSYAILAGIASDIKSGLMIAGFVTTATAGIGLASSYLAHRFFNTPNYPIPTTQNFEPNINHAV